MDYEKIDKLIAVHVMGWEIKPVDFKQDGSYYEAFFDGQGNRLGLVGAYEFNPSEYIQDAWIVVEKLNENGDFSVYKDCGDSKWKAELALSNIELYGASDETAPLVICKVALRSKGIDI